MYIYLLLVITYCICIKTILNNSICTYVVMFYLKLLHNLNSDHLGIPEADAMTTTPRRQRVQKVSKMCLSSKYCVSSNHRNHTSRSRIVKFFGRQKNYGS
jgi:hypothetical protein